MSADNGIYIAEFLDSWRVIHAQAIDNLSYYFEGSDEWMDQLKMYFGKAKLFKTKKEAQAEAFKIYDEIMESDFPVIEYGINILPKFDIDLGKQLAPPC